MYNEETKSPPRPRSYIHDILDSLDSADIQPATIQELYNELKRCRVFRVIIVYVVVGWGLFVCASELEEILALPDWADRLVLLLIGLGLPLAIVLAWIFDAMPQGIEGNDYPELDEQCHEAQSTGMDSMPGMDDSIGSVWPPRSMI